MILGLVLRLIFLQIKELFDEESDQVSLVYTEAMLDDLLDRY